MGFFIDPDLIEAICLTHDLGLSDFERMSQPGPVKVEFTRKKNLRLGLQPAKSRAVNDAVPVSLKSRSILVRFAPIEAFHIELVVKAIFFQLPHHRLF